jgi:hypothetical protein
VFENQSLCSCGWHATVIAPAARAAPSISSGVPSAETKESRPSARACADAFRVTAFRDSSTPARTTMRYESQALFASRAISSR